MIFKIPSISSLKNAVQDIKVPMWANKIPNYLLYTWAFSKREAQFSQHTPSPKYIYIFWINFTRLAEAYIYIYIYINPRVVGIVALSYMNFSTWKGATFCQLYTVVLTSEFINQLFLANGFIYLLLFFLSVFDVYYSARTSQFI